MDRLFGGGTIISPGANAPMGNTYRTICVRLGDGYYFPISFETTPDHFQQDAATCHRECPAAEVKLYTYHNPGETVSQAVSPDGQFYSELPSAFSYRKKLSGYSCRRPGQSWYEALIGNSPDQTAPPGDITIPNKTGQQQPQAAKAQTKTAIDPAKLRGSEDALAQTPGKTDDTTHRKVRQVGPRFLPSDNKQKRQ